MTSRDHRNRHNVVSYWWSIETMRLSCTVTEILGSKDIGVTTLTFWGHVTCSVTWPFVTFSCVVTDFRMITQFLLIYLHIFTVFHIHCLPSQHLQPEKHFARLSTHWTENTPIYRIGPKRDTIGLGICGFLLVVHWNHASILHPHEDVKPQRYWGHDLDLLGSRDVIGHVTIKVGICGFLLVVYWNDAAILHLYGDIGPQRY